MSGAETAGTYTAFECLTMEDVDQRLENVFNYFDNNTTKLMIYIGRYMDQRPTFGANASQNKQDGPLYSDFRFWRGGFSGRDFLNSVKSGSINDEKKDQDEESKQKEITLKQSELSEMQMIRRRASVIGLQEKIKKERVASGRKTTNAEETNLIVQEALKLAKQEEEEEDAMGLIALFGEEEECELPDEEKSWKYLPYNAMVGNAVDEALAEQLNIWEIDVNIKRLSRRRKKKNRNVKMKDIYRVNDTKYIVRFIHGVLLCRPLDSGDKKSTFEELIPLLRKLAGMPATGDAAARKGPTVHGGQ